MIFYENIIEKGRIQQTILVLAINIPKRKKNIDKRIFKLVSSFEKTNIILFSRSLSNNILLIIIIRAGILMP